MTSSKKVTEGERGRAVTITCSVAEWSALCICANHGATEMAHMTVRKSHGAIAQEITMYCAQAVKIIHSVLQPETPDAPEQSRAP